MNLNLDVIKDRSECSRLLFLESSQMEGSRDEGMGIIEQKKNIARIANAVPVTLYSRITVNDEVVVLNFQKCNQCLKCQVSGQNFVGLGLA